MVRGVDGEKRAATIGVGSKGDDGEKAIGSEKGGIGVPIPNLDNTWPRLSTNDVCPAFAVCFHGTAPCSGNLALVVGQIGARD